jgi:hypothetical protein
MTLKCGNGHELLEGAKFCGECGSPAPEDAPGKCASCAATMAKSAKFCGECGRAAELPDGAELDATLEDLNTFLKARTSYEDELLALPEIDDEDGVDQAMVDAVIERARVVDPETQEPLGIDAVPVVGEFLKGQAVGHTLARAHAEHLTAGMRHLFEGQGRLVKSHLAIAATLKSIRDDLAALLNTPRGRRAVQLAPPATVGTAGAGRAALKGPTGPDLMAKAVFAARKNPALMSTEEISKLETYALGEGWGLSQIAEIDPQLAARVDAALTATAAA